MRHCRRQGAGQRYAPADPNQCYLYGSSAVDPTGLDNAMPLLNQTNAILVVTLTTTHGTDNAIFILIHANATSMVEPKKEEPKGTTPCTQHCQHKQGIASSSWKYNKGGRTLFHFPGNGKRGLLSRNNI